MWVLFLKRRIDVTREPVSVWDCVYKILDLYVTVRDRYVLGFDGKYVTIRDKKITPKLVVGHLNGHFALSVFSPSAPCSKFICFDVDLDDRSVVERIIAALTSLGFPRQRIYVSLSGGKGYHVEMFFSDLVYMSLLRRLYEYVCDTASLDKRKVEFRPSSAQAIKIPLAVHPRSGRRCWYLDSDTFEPVEDIGYVLGIVPLDRDWVQATIGEKIPEPESHQLKKTFHSAPPVEGGAISDIKITRTGTRHHLMLSIGVAERYRKIPQEQIEAELIGWAERQPRELMESGWDDIRRDAREIAAWVWSPRFSAASRQSTFTLTERDLDAILSLHAFSAKQILFLVMLMSGRKLSVRRVEEITSYSSRAIKQSLERLRAEGYVVRKGGDKYLEPNRYEYIGAKRGEEGKSLQVFETDISPFPFQYIFAKMILSNVGEERLTDCFTRKQIDEMKKEIEKHDELESNSGGEARLRGGEDAENGHCSGTNLSHERSV